jgi:EAL domain-containing protein (putative c-di-GMP-specific phosphodiesterase class I)
MGILLEGTSYGPVERRKQFPKEMTAANATVAAAIDSNLLSLVYQPIFDVNGVARAVEALMRFKMPDGTAVSPKVFIPVAEQTGAIMELGRWVIETACRDILMTDRMATVSVNVSPVQLRSCYSP